MAIKGESTMRIHQLVLAEILGRPLNFLLSLLIVIVAAILFIVGPTIIDGHAAQTRRQLAALQASTEQQLAAQQADADATLSAMQQETDRQLAELDKATIRIMRDMGVNLRIVHRDTVFGDLYTDFVAVDFPEEYVHTLATAPQIETIVHLIATLQEKIKWNERSALLVGMFPVLTASQKNAEMQHMAEPVQPGTVVVGYELAAGLKNSPLVTSDVNGNGALDPGDELEILGRTFRVAEVRPEAGGLEDIQLVLDLHDAQQLVAKPGRIHQIMALNCKCKGNRLSVIRQELEQVLPDTKVTEHRSRAEAREMQRDLVAQSRQQQIDLVKAGRDQQMSIVKARGDEQLATVKANRERGEKTLTGMVAILLPLEVCVAAVVVGLMTWLNVRERRAEIGLLRALGKRTGQIALLLLSRSVVVGVFGGVLACLICALGAALVAASPGQFANLLETAQLAPSTSLLLLTILGAPIVTALASYLPMLSAVSQDPARILMET